MISSLWIAKTGLDAQQTNMDVIANNLANVSTNGFKRQRAVFEDLLYQTIRQPGAQSSEQTTLPSGLQIGTGVRPVATERLHSQGNLSQTNNSKDVAIKGQGFFQVMLPDGTSAYTRDGSFQVDQNGQLVTAGGFQVQPAITIPANALSITIGRDGVVSVTQQGQAAPVQVGQLNLTTFMNDTGLESIGENLYIETQSSGAPNESTPGLNGAGLLYQGYVETSNVNVAEELVNMIQVQRAYEINSKAVSTTDQMLQKLTQLLRGRRWGYATGSLILKMKVMQKYALHAYPVMALMVATLTGCAWIPAKPLVQGRPRRSRYLARYRWRMAPYFSLRSRLIMAISRFLKIVDRVISAIRSRLCYRKTSAPVKARRQMPAATAKPALVLIRYRVICRDYSVIPARIWRPPAATLLMVKAARMPAIPLAAR